MFDGWISTFINLMQNPFFLILGVLFSILVVFGILKRLFKLAQVVLAGFVIYIAFLMWTGRDIPTSLEGIKTSIQDTVSNSKVNLTETKDGIEEAAKEKAEKTFMNAIEDFFTGESN